MKTLSVLALVLTSASFAHADQKSDHDSIAAMKGCYEVNYHFKETGTTDPTYPTHSKEYNEYGTEWIELDHDTGSLLSLQHILITPDGPMKHWRQQWEYQPTNALYFKGFNTWRTEQIAADQSAGKWIQRVFQVDDSPRYECVAGMQKDAKGQAFWECSTLAPLPRREFSKRNDYNVVGRTNKQIITADGWLHEQNNTKLIMDTTGATTQIATEVGLDTYKRVEDSKCVVAQAYWAEHKAAWNGIQEMWMHMRSHHPAFSLQSKVNGDLLWEALFDLEETAMEEAKTQGTILDIDALQQKAHDLIHLYMVVLP